MSSKTEFHDADHARPAVRCTRPMIGSNCYAGVCPNARLWERELKNGNPPDADDARPVVR